jgi:predicted nucleic acid-binding protein
VIVVADAGPLLHLFWAGASSWALPPEPIDVVHEVWEEVEVYAPAVLQDARLRQVQGASAIPPRLAERGLDRGELAALAYALSVRETEEVLVLCDEREARRACTDLALPVVGSIGLILEAYRSGRVAHQTALLALCDLPTHGRLHVAQDLIEQAIAALGGHPSGDGGAPV